MDTLIPISAAAVTTSALMYPVDVMRALKMSSAGSHQAFSIGDFYRKFGLRGMLGQGLVPELVKSSSMRVSKFFLFPIGLNSIFGKTASKASPLEKGIAGALATVPEILMISPMEVAKIGLQLDKENKFKNNSIEFIKHIHKTKGFSGLYSGWAGMQWRQCWWTGLYFATLSGWKGLVEPPIRELGGGSGLASLASGFLAGVFASIPNAPGDVVRSVVQKKLFETPDRKAYGISPAGVMEHITVTREIVKQRGLKGLYSGFSFKALHLGGSGALMAFFIPVFANMFGIPYNGV
jgi:solute carrier family 25 2-oxodicarboxylate transporter 21